MDYRTRLYSECWVPSPGPNKVTLDLTRFLLHILLFDHYIMRSNRLRDIPELVDHFGYDGTHRLLQSSWFQLDLAPGGLGVIGDRTLKHTSKSYSVVGPYQFIRFKAAEPSAIVASECRSWRRLLEVFRVEPV